MKLNKDSKGSVVAVLLVIVVVGVVGFLGWRVFSLNKENKDLKKQQTAAPALVRDTKTAIPTSQPAEVSDISVRVLDSKTDTNLGRVLLQIEVKNLSQKTQTITSQDFRLRTNSRELLLPTVTMNELFPEEDLKSITLDSAGVAKKVLSFEVAPDNIEVLLFRDPSFAPQSQPSN